MDPTRRDALRVLAGVGTLGVAGCGGRGTGTPTGGGRGTDAETHSTEPSTGASTGSDASPELVLRRHEAVPDASLTVFPIALRDWIRKAAATGATVRGHENVPVFAPEPILAELDRVRLRTPDGDIDGTCEVDAEGGPRYEVLIAADPVESVPANETVTEVESLASARRELVLDAVDDTRPSVYPETELGEWVRHEFFGGYLAYQGETYVGREHRQTDAAFFSTTVWTVLSMPPATDGGADTEPVTLRLPEIRPGVRTAVDDALAGWEQSDPEARVRLRTEHDPDAVAAFAAGTEALLTHTTAFSVAVE